MRSVRSAIKSAIGDEPDAPLPVHQRQRVGEFTLHDAYLHVDAFPEGALVQFLASQ